MTALDERPVDDLGLIHLRHWWATVERIGRVITQRCQVCGATRTRVL